MAVLYFSGDQVAFFGGIDDNGTSSEFSDVNAPFLPTDLVEIEIPDQYILANGEFNPNEVQFSRVTVVRDGVRYDFDVNPGSKIKETGGSEVKEAGDTFFTTNDSVGPPGTGPFSGLSSDKMVFSTNSTFATGQITAIDRTTSTDLNDDGDTTDPGEAGNGNFNARQADTIPCYAPGTLIDTPEGPRAVETLRPGDLVMTLDHGPMPIRWVRSSDHPLEEVEVDAKPVLIAAGALGSGLPTHNLIVSPQHRILVGGRGQLQGPFRTEAFAPAKSLTSLPGIRHMKGKSQITWVHFACDRHEVVFANGCLSESLLLGLIAINGMTGTERSALTDIFGPAPAPDAALNGPPARNCLKVGEVRQLLEEYSKEKGQSTMNRAGFAGG